MMTPPGREPKSSFPDDALSAISACYRQAGAHKKQCAVSSKQCAVPGACQGNFNALATTLAGNAETPVYRLASSHGTVAPYTPGEMLFAPTLSRPTLTARRTAGARITTQSSDGRLPRPPACCS